MMSETDAEQIAEKVAEKLHDTRVCRFDENEAKFVHTGASRISPDDWLRIAWFSGMIQNVANNVGKNVARVVAWGIILMVLVFILLFSWFVGRGAGIPS